MFIAGVDEAGRGPLVGSVVAAAVILPPSFKHKLLNDSKKMTDKEYVRHTGHPGGQRFATPREVLSKNPRGVVEAAVKGMLPKTKLGSAMFKNLYLYEGTEHKHEAQQPKTINVNEFK